MFTLFCLIFLGGMPAVFSWALPLSFCIELTLVGYLIAKWKKTQPRA